MAQFHPAWVEHQRRRFMRPDAARYLKRMPYESWQAFEQRCAQAEGRDVASSHLPLSDAQQRGLTREIAELQVDHLELKWLVAEIKLEVIQRAFLLRKYRPDQPRVPAGNPDGGQWTSGNGQGTSGDSAGTLRNDPRVISDATPDNPWKPGAQYAQNDRPGIGHNKPPADVPKERPTTVQERHRIAREVARWRGPIGAFLAIGAWLQEFYPSIQSYRDPPKTLEELQQAVTDKTTPGYEMRCGRAG